MLTLPVLRAGDLWALVGTNSRMADALPALLVDQGHFMKHSHAQSVPAREPKPTPGTVIPRRRRGIPTQQRR